MSTTSSNSFKIETSCNKIWRKFRDWVGYYLCFCRGVFFASGLVFSDQLTEYSILALLITYFVYRFEGKRLTAAAILMNSQEGVSALSEIVMTFISDDVHLGRFLVIAVSSLFYVSGLVLLYLATRFEDSILDIIGILLLAVGQAGVRPLIREFIVDQFREHKKVQAKPKESGAVTCEKGQANPEESGTVIHEKGQANPEESGGVAHEKGQAKPEESGVISHDQKGQANPKDKRAIARKNVWCRFVWCLSALASFLAYNYFLWSKILMISIVATGSSLILFLCGSGCYHSGGLADGYSRLKALLVKMKKRNREQERHSTPSRKEEENERKRKIIFFEKMGLMWTTFLLFGLVLSAGKTFFPWQGQYMENYKFLPYFVVFQSISRHMISYLFKKLLRSKWISKDEQKKKDKRKKAKLLRIWIGMFLSIPCFIVAWRVEVRRLGVVYLAKEDFIIPEDDIIPMSIFWLVPQFCLMGFMEGLAQDGLDEFMMVLFPESKRDYVSAINALVIGLGNFSNILSVYVNRHLFASTVNKSQLDKYYMRLTIVTSVNLCYYSCISILFYYRSKKTPQTKVGEEDDETPKNSGLYNKGERGRDQDNPLSCLSDLLSACC